MSNIKKAFENGKAFIAFVTCGDPDLETTAKVVRAAVENGADLIELGIPFSDPTAEGPVIMLTEQREKTTSLRALRRKTDGDIATAPTGRDICERAWLTMTRVPAFFMGGQ